SRRRDRTGHERQPHRLERLRRQGFGRKSRPEAVAIARNPCKARDVVRAHEVIDFAPLDVGGAEVAIWHGGVPGPGPRLTYTGWQILGIGAHVERPHGVAPDLPGRPRGLQPIEKPALLLRAEDALRRAIAPYIGNLELAVACDERSRRPALVVV